MRMKKTKHPKNLKLLLLLVPLLGAIAISGCTTGSTGPTLGNGVAILNWEPTFSSVDSGDRLQLRVRVQNQGGMTADDVVARLTGINNIEWSSSGDTITFGTLLPPNIAKNTEGEMVDSTFELTAPSLPEGVTQQYSPSIRVYYVYTTTAIKPITLVNENELRRLQDQGKTLPSGDTTSTAGPLKVTVNTGKFIKAKTGGMLFSNTFPLTITIQNTGGGVVSKNTGGYDQSQDDYQVSYVVAWPAGLTGSCETASTLGGKVVLWKGQSASITCEATATPPLASVQQNIKIYLSYSYYIDSTTTITVNGIGQEIPSGGGFMVV